MYRPRFDGLNSDGQVGFQEAEALQMIEAVHFLNFKALRSTTLPLSKFTLLLGPNGSGKSTALQALEAVSRGVRANVLPQAEYRRFVTAWCSRQEAPSVEVCLEWSTPHGGARIISRWFPDSNTHPNYLANEQGRQLLDADVAFLSDRAARFSIFRLEPAMIAAPVTLHQNPILASQGNPLAAVLDQLRD